MKRILSALLAITLVFSIMPVAPMTAQAAGQSDLTFELNDDAESYSVTDCLRSASGSLAIPATYNGKPVTSIGDYAFYRCGELTDVNIPKSVISIGDFAFWYCSKLTSVSIPDSVISIGKRAFQETNLITISIPDSVLILGDHAFDDCTRLTKVSIGTNITSIGEYTFFGCKNLTVVEVPENVNNLGFYAFNSCTKLTTVIINCDTINIDYGAFYNCNNLKDVWYSGSIGDRYNITIAGDNKCLENATWHYNYCGSENHIYDSACDIDCNACGYERADFHVYENSCDTDCNECGVVRPITHTYDHDCDPVCNICAYERSVPDHIYTNSCDTDCNKCGTVRSITHTYDNACDTTCNVCRYVRETSHVYDNTDDVTCNVCKQTLAPAAPKVESVTDAAVTLVAVDNYEYSMNGTTWQNSNVFTGLQPFATYQFYQRVAAGTDNLASPASSPLSVTTDKHMPGIPEDFTFLEITDTSVTFYQVTDCEYSMDGTFWQTSPVFTGLVPGTQYTFYQRIAEDSQNYASGNAVLHITTYSKLGTITYDPNGGTGVPGTTTGKISTQVPTRSGCRFVGWALTVDTYAVYNPGDPYNQPEDIILYAAWTELCDVCDGEVYYYGKCPTCLGSGIRTETCSSCGGVGSITRKETCSAANCYNGTYIKDGVIRKCFACKGTGKVTKTTDCSNCQSGKVHFDCIMCGGDCYLDRKCEQCMSGVQGFTPEAPEMPKLQSISNQTVVLVDYPTCEYSMDGRTWQDSNVFSNLDTNTQYVFYQRYKATTYTSQSNTSPALKVRTLKERTPAPQPPVLQNKTFNKVVLQRVAGCEYSLDGINWQSDNVFADLLPSTIYTFYCRFAETGTHLHSYASDGLTVVTEDSPLFNVVFADWNGTVISSNTYRWGDEVSVPRNPVKAADNTYTYTFVGWDNTVVNCKGDATYTATYTATYIDYTVVFKDWDGTILSYRAYHWGEAVAVPSAPYRPNDSNNSYTFTGWDKAVVSCAGSAIYTAIYAANSLVPSAITSAVHTVSGDTISKITAGTTVSSLLSGFNEGSYCKVYKGNTEVSGSTTVGTGMVVKIMDGNTVKASYTIIVTGDTNGDGNITVTDMIAIKAHVLKKSTLSGVYATAADTNGDNGISITDFIQVKAKILGKGTITAR